MPTRFLALLLASLLACPLFVACSGDDGGDEVADARPGNVEPADASPPIDADPSAPDADPSAPDAAPRPDAAPTGDGDVPAESAALFAYLQAGSYETFEAESGVHPSPIHGSVRTFVNPSLLASLQAGNASHPVGAAAVKEIYTSGGTLRGWAVMVKVQANSAGGAGWYWYENFSTTINDPVADGTGVSGCAGCHGAGADFFRSPFPLQ